MDALVDVHDLCDAKACRQARQRVRIEPAQPGFEGEERHRVPERDPKRLIQITVSADRDPVGGCLRKRPLPARPFVQEDLDPDLPHRRLEAGEVDLAISLQGVRVSRIDLRALLPDGDVEGAPLG